MIDTATTDFENKVIDSVKTALSNAFSATYPNMPVYAEYVELPAAFPCVSIWMRDNAVYTQGGAIDKIENKARVTFECNVFCNDGSKKTTAKNIAGVIDAAMENCGFTRTFYNPIPNVDRTIYRLTMRWEAVVSKGITDGENTTFYVFH